jgi:hypothetical protein
MVEKHERTALTVNYKQELHERLGNTEIGKKLAKYYGGWDTQQTRHKKTIKYGQNVDEGKNVAF